MQMLLLDIDAITRNFFYFQIEASSEPEVKIFFKIRFILSKCHFFVYPEGLECPVHHSCPKKRIYFDLRFPESW